MFTGTFVASQVEPELGMLLATPLTKVLPTVFVMKPEPLSPEQRDASEDRTSKLLP
jgi:hypothetical protein